MATSVWRGWLAVDFGCRSSAFRTDLHWIGCGVTIANIDRRFWIFDKIWVNPIILLYETSKHDTIQIPDDIWTIIKALGKKADRNWVSTQMYNAQGHSIHLFRLFPSFRPAPTNLTYHMRLYATHAPRAKQIVCTVKFGECEIKTTFRQVIRRKSV